MSTPWLVIFDNDGVLVDSEPISNAVLAATLTALGLPTTTQAVVGTYVGMSLRDIRARAEEELGRALPADFEMQFEDALIAEFERSLRPVVGARELVARLVDLGVSICVASSGSHRRLRASLAQCGLLDVFGGAVFSSDDVARGKPAADLFLAAARAMNVPASRTLVIEDSDRGIAAGRAAGMTVWALRPDITEGTCTASRCFATHRDVIGWVAGRWSAAQPVRRRQPTDRSAR